ncbi:hypothetical protein SAMN06265349_101705 [Flavobacterium resistens]|uniref:Uncharacterized protein n=1 Tax=Flavobacterium resistens TaxID=443612 RepID=A0A521B5J9_9FLAO|nr:hypothetical protein SAMN06265349_101705 [Flavobacterium resistens]
MNSFKVEKCPHNNRVLRVIESVATSEKTVLICKDCEKQLSEPKTDCI